MFTEDTLNILIKEDMFGESNMRLCLSCHETQEGVEEKCKYCGKFDVVGLKEALLLADWDGHTPTPSGV